MILRRVGNKRKISKEIIKHFPAHDIWIEPFFGAGGMFFNKPKAKYNIVNDIDSDVFNLYMVVMEQKETIYRELKKMPIHNDLFQYWRKNKEVDPMKKALRFLFLSNFSYLGMGDTLKFGINNTKEILLSKIDKTFNLLSDVQFNNTDFRKFLKEIAFRKIEGDKDKILIYCDPPYLGTRDNYSHSFKENDFIDLLTVLEWSKCMFCISEFDNPIVVQEAKKRGLNIIYMKDRISLKNRSTEILLTNYKNNQLTIFE